MAVIIALCACDDMFPFTEDADYQCFDIPYYKQVCFYFADTDAFTTDEMTDYLAAYEREYFTRIGVNVHGVLAGITVSFWDDFEYSGCVRCEAVARDRFNLWVELPYGWQPIGTTGFFWHLNACVLWQLYGSPGYGEHSDTKYPWTDEHTEMINKLNREFS